ISNGGYGGLVAALSHGAPVLAVPASIEKWVGAGNVAASGAARRLSPRRLEPQSLREVAIGMLEDSDLSARARDVAYGFRAAGGPERAAQLCEEVAAAAGGEQAPGPWSARRASGRRAWAAPGGAGRGTHREERGHGGAPRGGAGRGEPGRRP